MNIVITGASGGIGTAIAFALQNKNKLVLHRHNNPISKTLAEYINIKCDLSVEKEVKHMFKMIKEQIGEIDVLINNCGISGFSLLQDLSLEDWNKMLAVNLSSAFLCTKEVIPLMLKNGGHIVNISSVWGQCGASCEAHYSAAKGGLIAFTKAMALELAPSNIKVNCICPGFIETEMNSTLTDEDKNNFIENIPLNRAGKPEEVARVVEFLINQDYITGQIIAVNGGLYM